MVIGLRIVVDVGRLRQRIGLELFLARDTIDHAQGPHSGELIIHIHHDSVPIVERHRIAIRLNGKRLLLGLAVEGILNDFRFQRSVRP